MAVTSQRLFQELRQKIVNLGLAVEEAIAKAIRVLKERNATLAEEVIAADAEIDRLEILIEEQCLKLLALHQPCASDLRMVVAVLKINNDFERIGDLAKNVCKRVAYLVGRYPYPYPVDFEPLAVLSQDMTRFAIDAFVDNDAALARKVCQREQDADATYHDLHERIVAEIRQHPDRIDALLKLFAIARHLERIGDYAVHVAQEVIHVVQADIVRHLPIEADV